VTRLGASARPTTLVLLLGVTLAVATTSRADDALGGLPSLPSGALRVFLVRHGQALSNLDPAPSLPPAELDHLTPLGARQAEAAGRALAGRGVASVLTSPASRARETAEGLSRGLALASPKAEPRLRPMEKGESAAQVGDRVDHLVRALGRSRRGKGVVLVAHGEVLAAYLDRFRGASAPRRDPKSLATGSITVVDVAPTGRATIRLENHRPALP
jgi:broad specificity phosphatase PhoE